MKVWIVEFQDKKGRPYDPVGPWYFHRDGAMYEAKTRQKSFPDFKYRVRQYERAALQHTGEQK